MNTLSPRLLWALCLVLLGGCSAPADTGSAQLAVSGSQALAASVSRITVTASAPDFPSMSLDLALANGVWSGLLGGIPAGSNRVFLAQAFDSSGTLRFQGQAAGVSITANQTLAVVIHLLEVSPPAPYDNEAPLIDSLVASATSIPLGGTISLTVTAHDPNPGDTLSFAWTASSGTFSTPTSATPSWTAPTTAGIQTLTVTVKDSQGSAVSATLAINVTSGASTGSAVVSIDFDFSPTVSGISSSLNRLDAGQTTTVTVSASDPDGDRLAYQWAASCPGVWTNATSSSASFSPSSRPASACNNCRLTVTVHDVYGGQTTGSLALCVAAASARERFPPSITHVSQTPLSSAPGQPVDLDITASDPQSSPLSFAWTATTGSLGAASTGSSTSHMTWTAPSCVSSGTSPSITATVTNGYGLKATQVFPVTGLPVCDTSTGWAPTGSMNSPREGHTATLLPNGKVLVAGGRASIKDNIYLASAELYDPASGTWSPTGAMLSLHFLHTATLLPNGKVLVVGGSVPGAYSPGAELYDPASGTWSSTGTMLTPRSLHTATLLSNGKVLVTGGIGGGISLPSAELYDPASGTWSATGRMVSPRYSFAAVLLPGGKVLAAGGMGDTGDGYLTSAELYDPASGSWSAASSMILSHDRYPAVLLPNGKTLVSGGALGPPAEVYDLASNTWSLTGRMIGQRIQHQATRLSDGRVLVSGGQLDTGTRAEGLYDLFSSTWIAVSPMSANRFWHTATLLPNGQVLAAGGGTSGGDLATAELYTP